MSKRASRRDLKKESFWRRTIRRQSGSGLSVRGWCRDQGVSEACFHWWRRELARRDAEPGPACVAADRRTRSGRPADRGAGVSGVTDRVGQRGPALFLPVHVSGAAAEGSRIEIVLPDGHRVRVQGPVDRQALTDVLAVLTPGVLPASEATAC